jgi:selenide,water dikinase
VDDPEPKYGLSVIGIVEPGKQVSNAGAQVGDVLVLSKPIGTGIITTAGKQGVVDPDVMSGAVATMAALNRPAAQAMQQVGVNAATDITGFGLLGHLKGMARGSGVAAAVSLAALPVLPGARELLENGVAPGGTHRNVSSVEDVVTWDAALTEEDRLLLCDAQTSGGLLMSVPANKVDALVAALREEGAPCAAVVGRITDGPAGTITASK